MAKVPSFPLPALAYHSKGTQFANAYECSNRPHWKVERHTSRTHDLPGTKPHNSRTRQEPMFPGARGLSLHPRSHCHSTPGPCG